MIVGVIDIGSNSVRAMGVNNHAVFLKELKTTRLLYGQVDGVLNGESMQKTYEAIVDFCNLLKEYKAQEIYIFATEAVRIAKNGAEFTKTVFDLVGIKVDVLSGDEEAEVGLLGALNGKDGAMLDIGGGSSELAITKNGKIIYSHSLNVGAVKMKDKFNCDYNGLDLFLNEKVKEYGEVPKIESLVGIGGTIIALSGLSLNLRAWDPAKTDGNYFSVEKLQEMKEQILSSTVEERIEKLHIDSKRAEIIDSGACILLAILKYLNVKGITSSENDNLLGYLKYKKII